MMKRAGACLSAVLFAACGYSTEKFVQQSAEGECAYAISCFDEQVLEFNDWTAEVVDGEEITAQQKCETDVGPRVAGLVAECLVYDSKAAKQCVKDWALQDCPGEGEDPAEPSICSSVFTDCGGTLDGDTGTGDTGE